MANVCFDLGNMSLNRDISDTLIEGFRKNNRYFMVPVIRKPDPGRLAVSRRTVTDLSTRCDCQVTTSPLPGGTRSSLGRERGSNRGGGGGVEEEGGGGRRKRRRKE